MEYLAGADHLLAVDSHMMRRTLLAMIGCVGLAAPMSAQDAFYSGGDFSQVNVALSRTWSGFPALGLADRQSFAFPGSFGWMNEPADFLPAFAAQPLRRSRAPRARAIAQLDGPESSDQLGTARRNLFYTRGEVDFVYGKYTGKNGGDFKQGYVIGEIGNEHFSLSVGASYGEWSGGDRRRRR